MTIAVPVDGQDISAATFGAPVANALNAITDGVGIVTAGGATIGGNLAVAGIGQLLSAYKTANQIVNNTAALANDTHLLLAMAANGVYEFLLRLHYLSGTTPDYKIGWIFPVGLTMVWGGTYADTTGAFGTVGNLIQTSTPSICGSGTDLHAVFGGVITNGATAGTLRLTEAQSTANASNSTLYLGSSLVARRIA